MVRKHDRPPEKGPVRPVKSSRGREARTGSVRETRRQEKTEARNGRAKKV